jgi:hypothetical protein
MLDVLRQHHPHARRRRAEPLRRLDRHRRDRALRVRRKRVRDAFGAGVAEFNEQRQRIRFGRDVRRRLVRFDDQRRAARMDA